MGFRALISLLCPECGEDLTGLGSDSFFGCLGCGLAYRPTVEGLGQPYPVRQSPQHLEGLAVALPFWRFEVEPMLLPEGIFSPKFAYIPAFDLRRRSFFGDPGLKWTMDRIIIIGEDQRQPLIGMTLGLDEAIELGYHSVLKALDVQKDVTGYNFDINLINPTILIVEFSDDDLVLIDPITEERYGASAFCDLPMFRAARGGY